MIHRVTLVSDLRKQIKVLEDDLLVQSIEDEQIDIRFRAEWQAAHEVSRTASSFESWRDERVTQAAVAWVLGTVFVRFSEDNGLIEQPYIAGPGERLEIAQERQSDFFRRHPEKTDRDWVLESFRALSVSQVSAGLFSEVHNPMWMVNPSHEAAKDLLSFWRAINADREVNYLFVDDAWDTRFLGDLYQNLSERARKVYALLQTPEFIVEFILDRSLDPAIDEFGLDGLRLIDPACGCGHFLLGAFRRLLDKQQSIDDWTRIRRTLASVHGVDKNPFAVVIARFRLLVAAMKAGGVRLLTQVPEFPINVAVGDSLLHGRAAPSRKERLFGERAHHYAHEDVSDFSSVDLLGAGSYHVVVGNPPYITPKDKRESENYREGYDACYREYALSVPFSQRFFQLARRATSDRRGAGYVSLILSNSFMKREFGRKLVEGFFALEVELTQVVDTSGLGPVLADHGTPTVIIVGRNTNPRPNGIVRTVMGIRGEPSKPDDPTRSHVWRAIIKQIDCPGSESDWVSVVDLSRDRLSTHPWSISGGGAAELVEILQRAGERFGRRLDEAGCTAITGEDSAFLTVRTAAMERRGTRIMRGVEGENVRDWDLEYPTWLLSSYSEEYELSVETDLSGNMRYLWPVRHILWMRKRFSVTMRDRRRPWYEWREIYVSKLRSPFLVAYAEVATHNHFLLSRGDSVFTQTAPVLKFSKWVAENEHLGLVGVLNSSIVCFLLKQMCFDKGTGGIGGGISDEMWEHRFAFNAMKVEQLSLPEKLPMELGRQMDLLVRHLRAVDPSVLCAEDVPTRGRLEAARADHLRIQRRMIALQEELDWEVYKLYALLDETEAIHLRADQRDLPELKLGERAFEILLARNVKAERVQTQWFARHGSVPIAEIPRHWPESYRKVVQTRIETIERRRDIALMERPECKRRWASIPWEKKERDALRTWLLDRCEGDELWLAPDAYGNIQPRPLTVNQLADNLRINGDIVDVARLYTGRDDDLADVLANVINDEHVPYLAALRYKDTGLRKRVQWESVWRLQRREDETGERLDIPVPPKYISADFRKTSYWRNRGKLDVPKERFISYLDAGTETDRSLLLGWAGWDHREQAHVLMTLIEERHTVDGWDRRQLTPLIAGLAEVMPWVQQWYSDINLDFGQSWAEAYQQYLEAQQLRHGLTDEDLQAWRPVVNGRGRRSNKA